MEMAAFRESLYVMFVASSAPSALGEMTSGETETPLSKGRRWQPTNPMLSSNHTTSTPTAVFLFNEITLALTMALVYQKDPPSSNRLRLQNPPS